MNHSQASALLRAGSRRRQGPRATRLRRKLITKKNHKMRKFLPVGKLKIDFLESLLSQVDISDKRVVIGPRIGEDATVIDFGEKYLVAKTDPITFATDHIGWYLVCVNSNDIATMGATPKWLLVTILLPESETTEKLVRSIFTQIDDACRHFGITVCGGHTEITHGLNRPIVIGQMLGEVEKDKLITSEGAKVGDDIILTKGLGIEATSIISREKQSELKSKYSVDKKYDRCIERAQKYLTDPGISVLKDALIANETGGVNAMHDPTEGGVATAINELAQCSNVGAKIWEDRLLISPETEKLCQEYQIDPLGVISSGALIIAAIPSYSDKILYSLRREGIDCDIIGKMVPVEEKVKINSKGKWKPLPAFESDEIAKIYN